jgi:hypothetical protein
VFARATRRGVPVSHRAWWPNLLTSVRTFASRIGRSMSSRLHAASHRPA